MIELVSSGLAWLWAVCISLRGITKNIAYIVNYVSHGIQPRPLTSSKARGLEWRAIRPIGGRLVNVRLQVVIA